MKNNNQFWVILDHPKQFLLAVYLSQHLFDKFKIKTNLLISKHEYWKYFNIANYKKYFNDIYWFKRLDYPPFRMNIIKQLAASLLLIPQLFILKFRVRKIDIKNNDVVIGLTFCQFLENLVISTFPNTVKVTVLPLSEYKHYEKKPNSFYVGISSKITAFLIKIFGMHETVFSYRKNVKNIGDGDYYLSYKSSMKQVYDKILLTVSNIDNSMTKNVSDMSDKKIKLCYFPRIDFLKGIKKNDKKKVVFMGQPLVLLGNRNWLSYLKILDQCLGYLYKIYNNRFDLVYKMHPREKIYPNLTNLIHFKIDRKKIPAEIFFLKNKHNIEAVFSVSSSTFRSAINTGLKSYLFAKLFPNDGKFMKDLYMALGEISDNAFITNLNSPPKKLKYTKIVNKYNFINNFYELLE